jgi:hypothetical protein
MKGVDPWVSTVNDCRSCGYQKLVKGYKAGVTELPLWRDVSIFVTGLLDFTDCESR